MALMWSAIDVNDVDGLAKRLAREDSLCLFAYGSWSDVWRLTISMGLFSCFIIDETRIRITK